MKGAFFIAEYKKPGDRLKEITDQLEKGIQDLFASGQYADYLKTMSKFYDYSASNSLLIFLQRPDASYVAGYGAWQKNFKRQVKRGEHGIKILAPCPYKQQVDMEKIDPVTQRAMVGPDGKPVTEVMEVQRAAFKPVTVFDVSQTEGEPLPQLGIDELTGDVKSYPEFFEALKQIAPFPIAFEAIGSGAKGYCNFKEQRITINEGMAEIQNVKTAIHEITHATLHNYYAEKEKETPPEQRKDQRTREVEAESVAYTVCQHYGIETSEYSFGYIAGWSSDKETKELKGSLTTIRETAAGLITSIDEKYREIVKGQEKSAPEQPGIEEWSETATAENAPDIPGVPSDNVNVYLQENNQQTFFIYQLKSGDTLHYHRFEPLERLQAAGLSVEAANYDLMYTAPLNQAETLEDIFTRFNVNRPEDFKGHSLSVSDVVVLHQDGGDSAYYVDSFGFSEVPQFIEQQRAAQSPVFPRLDPKRQQELTDAVKDMLQMMVDHDMRSDGKVSESTLDIITVQGFELQNGVLEKVNPLAAAEMSSEQNYNMIDGLLNNQPFMPEATMNERANALIDLVEQDGQRFGNGERRLIVEYAEQVQDNQKLFALVNELAEQGFEQKNHYVNPAVVERVDTEITAAKVQRMIDGPLEPIIQPIVTIIWSESNRLRDGQQMTLAEANELFQRLDAAHTEPGYDKTEFRIDFTFEGELDSYEGRQDFGDGDGSLIDHIKEYHEFYAKDEVWKDYVLRNDGPEGLEQDIAHREMLLHKFIPYLKLHCNLTLLEQAGAEQIKMLRGLPEPDALDQSKIAYYEAIQNYIDDCRRELNTATGEYHLPEMPKEQDAYTPELLAYQEQVREEVRQEAAAAGMTVEEYAANDYEPLSSPQPVKEQNGTPAMDAIEEQVERGEAVSLMDMVEAAKADKGQVITPYYTINENAARLAKNANSFYEYKPGSATAEYRHYVDEAVEIAERQKARVDPMHHEKIDRLLDTYSRKLAANMNHGYSIASRVPSILIAGGSNFPTRKKEKQNQASDSNMREWQEIQGLLDKIRSTGMGGISADDPNAIEKLQAKLAGLEQSQETMKAVNAYYRKHKTLDGCTLMPQEKLEKLTADMANRWYGRVASQPFEPYSLQNNNAEIRRTKARVEELTRKAEQSYSGWEFDGGKVEVNKTENRLQVFFDEKPDEEKRTELKSNGFRWSPKAGAWQRQINSNAFFAANYIKCIQPLTGEKPTELQRKARIQKPSIKAQLETAKKEIAIPDAKKVSVKDGPERS